MNVKEFDHWPEALVIARRNRSERFGVLNTLYGMRAQFLSGLQEGTDSLDLFDYGPLIPEFADIWEEGKVMTRGTREQQRTFFNKTAKTIERIEGEPLPQT